MKSIFDDRLQKAQNGVAKSLYRLIAEKKSNIVLSLDVPQKARFFDILNHVADEIVVLKIHIDIMHDFNDDFIKELLLLKEKHHFLIFEDRKFADIGNTVKAQYTEGIFKIIEWADIVTAHIFPGPGCIEGLRSAWQETQIKDRAVVILPQMTSRDNLFDDIALSAGIKWAHEYCDIIIGFIGSASVYKDTPERETQLMYLRKESLPEMLILTPGIQLDVSGDNLGQTYVTPETSISQGGDLIIVGRGIYNAENPLKSAEVYKKAGWDALVKRETEKED
jgi:uridine monophosphate synthetase